MLEHWFLKCGHQASRVSIIWKLVIDVNLCPRPSESETLGIENSIHAICASQSSQVILKYNEPGTLCDLLKPWVTYLRNGANNLPYRWPMADSRCGYIKILATWISLLVLLELQMAHSKYQIKNSSVKTYMRARLTNPTSKARPILCTVQYRASGMQVEEIPTVHIILILWDLWLF